MALALNDRVQQQGTANTTVSFTLTASVTGFQTFAVIGNGNTTYYAATDATGNWEVGIGTYSTTGPTLTRTTILASSNSGSAVTFSGTVNVFVTYPSEKSVNLDGSNNVSALGTISSGTWQGTTVGVAYGGTGVTASSGANSVVLRDSNQNISVNSVTQASTKVTSAAGTTTLTPASPHFQILTGTTTQTFKLPDATTLSNGSSWVFDNDSTGNLTITDNASATIDVVAPGGYTTVFLESNATVGGEWGKFGMIPSEVNWGTNSLDLGGLTTITNGLWNGNTIGTAYGGTGLTGFGSANYALYSTSSSALTAGTLPVAAGGTSLTSYTTGDIIYASATNTLSKLGVGTNGQVLTSNGTIPTWSTLSSAAVTTFSAGTTGFTPSTATSGAITLAGTLATTNGGTGLTSFTSGGAVYATSTSALTTGTLPVTAGGTGQSSALTQYGVIYASTTSAMGTTAAGTSTQVLHGNAAGAPTWGAVSLTADVSGTLPVANGGTGQTTYTDGQLLIGNSTGNTLTKATLTAGSGISITNGGGSISIASTVTSGLTISASSTNSTFYLPFTSATSGSISSANINTSVNVNPSTGALTAPEVVASNGMLVHSSTVSTSYSIPAGSNAIAAGPMTVASGASVTIPSGSRWLVL